MKKQLAFLTLLLLMLSAFGTVTVSASEEISASELGGVLVSDSEEISVSEPEDTATAGLSGVFLCPGLNDYERISENEWYMDPFMINGNPSTLRITATADAEGIVSEMAFSDAHLEVNRLSVMDDEAFKRFVTEPEVMTTVLRYKYIYTSYVAAGESEAEEYGVALCTFYSEDQRCTFRFVCSDPVFLASYAPTVILDTISFTEAVYKEPEFTFPDFYDPVLPELNLPGVGSMGENTTDDVDREGAASEDNPDLLIAKILLAMVLPAVLGLLIYSKVEPIYWRKDHGKWGKGANPSADGKITNLSSKEKFVSKRNKKYITTVTFSDGYIFKTAKTDRSDDNGFTFRIFISTSLREEIVRNAVNAHNAALEKRGITPAVAPVEAPAKNPREAVSSSKASGKTAPEAASVFRPEAATEPTSEARDFICRACGKELPVKYRYKDGLCTECAEHVPAGTAGALFSFSMTVEDVFLISRGVVLCGAVEGGSVRKGDQVLVNGVSYTVLGIEREKKLVHAASAGENVGLLIDSTDKDKFRVNDRVMSPAVALAVAYDDVPDEYKSELRRYAGSLIPGEVNEIGTQRKMLEMMRVLIPIEETMMEMEIQHIFETGALGELSMLQFQGRIGYQVNEWLAICNEGKLAEDFQNAELPDLLSCFAVLSFYHNILKPEFSKNLERYCRHLVVEIYGRKFEIPKPKEFVPIRFEGCSIYLDSREFFKWKRYNPSGCQFEETAVLPLYEKEPVITLYEDGVIVREYRLEAEGEEDFSRKYFHISVRIGLLGIPAVPAAQIDGFISDTSKERQMTPNDVGYRMEGYILRCGGEESKKRYKAIRGQDLTMKGLKYPGYTTPSNVRLIGICPDCGRSFCFRGYAFHMIQNDVAYSDDGQDCCEIRSYKIDKETWTYEVDGKVFRYYNSFCCPHCGTPYIDYKKHPENKVFGVSGCVHLGRTAYTEELGTGGAEPETVQAVPEDPQNAASVTQDGSLDDVTFIREMTHLRVGGWHQYDVLLAARGYGWDMMKIWADYMAEADLQQISQVAVSSLGAKGEKDITASYISSGRKCQSTPELETEMGMLSVAGISRALGMPMKIVWINQTQTLRFFTLSEDEELLKRYAETVVRRSFGTKDAMKLGKPIPDGQ